MPSNFWRPVAVNAFHQVLVPRVVTQDVKRGPKGQVGYIVRAMLNSLAQPVQSLVGHFGPGEGLPDEEGIDVRLMRPIN